MITLSMYAKATTAAQAVEDFRSRDFFSDRNMDYTHLCEKLSGEVVFNDKEDNGRVTSSLHLFPDGSVYYDDDSDNYPLESLQEFIDNREAMMTETVDGIPVWSESDKMDMRSDMSSLYEKLSKRYALYQGCQSGMSVRVPAHHGDAIASYEFSIRPNHTWATVKEILVHAEDDIAVSVDVNGEERVYAWDEVVMF